MRLLQVVQRPQRRGAEMFAYQLGQELRRLGHVVHTAYLEPQSGPQTLPLDEHATLLAGGPSRLLERVTGFDPLCLLRLRRLVAAWRPDVVQVGGGRTVKYGAALRRRGHDRWVLVCRNIGRAEDWVNGWSRRFVYRRLIMPRVDGVVSVTGETRAGFVRLYAPSVPVCTISTGVDPDSLAAETSRGEVRRRSGTPPQAPVLLFVGSLSAEKRPDRLLRVMRAASLRVPELRLWIVGDGRLRPSLDAQAESLGISARVSFLGSRSDVGSFMRAADLLLLTSDSEGIPRVVLEAGLVGLAVVAPRLGGIWEFVRHEETGLLVEPGDEPETVRAVVRLLGDPELRVRMGRKAAAWVGSNFTMEIVARSYLEFYRTVRSTRGLA